MAIVIALHGAFGNGRMLQEDCGDPSWIDYYHDYHSLGELIQFTSRFSAVIVVGFSLGGSRIGSLTHYAKNIVGAVLYESPLLRTDTVGTASGNFPAMIIRNDQGKWMESSRDAAEWEDTVRQWNATGRPVEYLEGHGRHTKRVPRSWFPWWSRLGHGWDVSLNDQIGHFISRIDNKANTCVA